MIDNDDVIKLVLAFLKDSEFKKANEAIKRKIDQVFELKATSDREKVCELNKKIFILNRTIEKYKANLEKIRSEVTDPNTLMQLEQCLNEISDERQKIINLKRNI